MENLVRIHDLSQQEKEAMRAQVAYWTHSLVDHDDPSGGGSAIPIRVGTRNFLATAAHVIQDDHRFELVRREGEESISDFTKKCLDIESDVGALELDADNAAKISGFVPENQILVEFDQKEEWAVFVTGFPGEASLQTSLDRIVKVQNIVIADSIPQPSWPDNLENPADMNSDMFVGYPDDMDVSIFWPNKVRTESDPAPSKPPHPGGMSGGGIWVLSSTERKSGVWQPYVRLVGLEVGYLEKSQLLHGIRIGKWLDLIDKNYPDLQESISSIVKRN